MGRHVDAPDFTDLLELLEEKRALVEELLRLTDEMKTVLDGENFDQLEELFDERQSHMDRVDSLNARIDLAYIASRPTMSDEGLEIFRTHDAAVNELMQRLHDEDKQVSSSIRALLVSLKQSLAEVAVQRKGLLAYGESQQMPGGILLDEKK